MPELPEVHTTVMGLRKTVVGHVITDVWTDYYSRYYTGKKEIKNPDYFKYFCRLVKRKTITDVRRRGKNILIDLSDDMVILVHMKMTGHFLFGTYQKKTLGKKRETWIPLEKGPFTDPFNRFAHLVFSLSSGKHLVLSDLRKFARVSVYAKKDEKHQKEISMLGPEPLENAFTYTVFKKILLNAHGPIKKVLMDQKRIAGIGNIYSDEILWASAIHPLVRAPFIPKQYMKKMFSALKSILRKGIDFRGDSTSDYRDIYSRRGSFQAVHRVYRKTNTVCDLKKCGGKIARIAVAGRSAHFCPVHQKGLEWEHAGK